MVLTLGGDCGCFSCAAPLGLWFFLPFGLDVAPRPSAPRDAVSFRGVSISGPVFAARWILTRRRAEVNLTLKLNRIQR